jgi:hypothetical protein
MAERALWEAAQRRGMSQSRFMAEVRRRQEQGTLHEWCIELLGYNPFHRELAAQFDMNELLQDIVDRRDAERLKKWVMTMRAQATCQVERPQLLLAACDFARVSADASWLLCLYFQCVPWALNVRASPPDVVMVVLERGDVGDKYHWLAILQVLMLGVGVHMADLPSTLVNMADVPERGTPWTSLALRVARDLVLPHASHVPDMIQTRTMDSCASLQRGVLAPDMADMAWMADMACSSTPLLMSVWIKIVSMLPDGVWVPTEEQLRTIQSKWSSSWQIETYEMAVSVLPLRVRVMHMLSRDERLRAWFCEPGHGGLDGLEQVRARLSLMRDTVSMLDGLCGETERQLRA